MKAEAVVVIPTFHHDRYKLKIIMSTKEHAKCVIIKGFWIQRISIESQYIQKEKVDNINQCYKCFSFNHVTNKCLCTNQLCSICPEEHNFKECPNKNNIAKIKYANCNDNHIAIAKSCPTKKEKIQQLLDEEQQKEQQNLQTETESQPNNPLSVINFLTLNTGNYPSSSHQNQSNTSNAWTNNSILNRQNTIQNQ